MFATVRMSGDNRIAGDAVLGRSPQTLLSCLSDAPFSAPQPRVIHSFKQVFHRVIHRILQPLAVFCAFAREKAQALDFPQPHYYYCFLIIIKTAVVVGGCGYVDKTRKALPDKVLRENTLVDNFVDSVKSLWKSSLTRIAQLLLIACFFVQGRADASEILVNMHAIAHIESKNNPAAWNKREDARGMYQLRSEVLQEWNDANPKDKHQPADLFKKTVNEKIARWYLSRRIPQMIRAFKKPVTERNVIIAYNAGVKYVKTGAPLPRTTRNYLSQYERIAA